MPFQIIRQDITKIKVDAVVNAANESLLGGGGVDGAIHAAAGPELLKECRTLGGCKTGQAKITKGYNLPAKYIIHTVGPVYRDGKHGERELLSSCYTESLKLAKENDCKSIAFSFISTGVYGYPKKEALHIAAEAIMAFLEENEMDIYLLVFGKSALDVSKTLMKDVQVFIDDNYVSEALEKEHRNRRKRSMVAFESLMPEYSVCCESNQMLAESETLSAAPKKNLSVEDALKNLDESFSQAVQRMVDEKGMTDVQLYHKALIGRKTFSKARKIDYVPSKETAIALAMGLELDYNQTQSLLQKAGYALSNTKIFDVIITYCINNKIYDIFEVNDILMQYDQKWLRV